ncbi:hypothetical protein [Shewanella sp. KJ2020]|uniref:hypothetical protein n=1 Tax=Shewanella sp. KJ2020 TaxID=2919172 RepID=UPI0020A7D467|nr:hypothetical protein [Shewanella sp. KJ2020]MCP3128749.1 hypothetical protein [Shewanella sp. KJ2020]
MKRNRTGLGPALGESLHSFIFRVLNRIGHSDFSTVLTSGGWGSKPSIPLSTCKEFEGFSRHELLKVFEESYSCELINGVLGSHFRNFIPSDKNGSNGRLLFRDVFCPEKEKHYAGQPMIVKYCINCIFHQIERNGFAFFTVTWSENIWCEIHSKPLQGFGWGLPLNCVVKAVKQVLKGETPSHSRELTEHDDRNVGRPKLTPIILKFAPCAKTALINDLIAKEYYPNNYIELVDYGFLTTLGRQVLSKWRFREYMTSNQNSVIEEAIEQNYEEIMECLINKMKLVNVKYIDEIVQSDDRWLLKNKDLICGKCAITQNISYEECSASQLIYLPAGPWAITKFSQSKNNICDRNMKKLSEDLPYYQAQAIDSILTRLEYEAIFLS